mgnify:FL=1
MTEDFLSVKVGDRLIRMSVEEALTAYSGLKYYSDHELGQMLRGVESEMRRLNRAEEGWPGAAWKASSNIRKAIGAELKSRRSDFQLSLVLHTQIDF